MGPYYLVWYDLNVLYVRMTLSDRYVQLRAGRTCP